MKLSFKKQKIYIHGSPIETVVKKNGISFFFRFFTYYFQVGNHLLLLDVMGSTTLIIR